MTRLLYPPRSRRSPALLCTPTCAHGDGVLGATGSPSFSCRIRSTFWCACSILFTHFLGLPYPPFWMADPCVPDLLGTLIEIHGRMRTPYCFLRGYAHKVMPGILVHLVDSCLLFLPLAARRSFHVSHNGPIQPESACQIHCRPTNDIMALSHIHSITRPENDIDASDTRLCATSSAHQRTPPGTTVNRGNPTRQSVPSAVDVSTSRICRPVTRRLVGLAMLNDAEVVSVPFG